MSVFLKMFDNPEIPEIEFEDHYVNQGGFFLPLTTIDLKLQPGKIVKMVDGIGRKVIVMVTISGNIVFNQRYQNSHLIISSCPSNIRDLTFNMLDGSISDKNMKYMFDVVGKGKNNLAVLLNDNYKKYGISITGLLKGHIVLRDEIIEIHYRFVDEDTIMYTHKGDNYYTSYKSLL